jgi:hypothetical protein
METDGLTHRLIQTDIRVDGHGKPKRAFRDDAKGPNNSTSFMESEKFVAVCITARHVSLPSSTCTKSIPFRHIFLITSLVLSS